jgi:hypothetical protein
VTKFNIANESYNLPGKNELKPTMIDDKLFELITFKAYPLLVNYSSQQYIDVVNTYSPTLAMDVDKRTAFLQELKQLVDKQFLGKVEKHYAMTLTIAKKRQSYIRG